MVVSSGDFDYFARIMLFDSSRSDTARVLDSVIRSGPFVYVYRPNVGMVRWNCLTDDFDFLPTPVLFSHVTHKSYEEVPKIIQSIRSQPTPVDAVRLINKELATWPYSIPEQRNKVLVAHTGNFTPWYWNNSSKFHSDLYVIYDFDTRDTYGFFVQFVDLSSTARNCSLFVYPSDPAVSYDQFVSSFPPHHSLIYVNELFHIMLYFMYGSTVAYYIFEDHRHEERSLVVEYEIRKGASLRIGEDEIIDSRTFGYGLPLYIRNDFRVLGFEQDYFRLGTKRFKLNPPSYLSKYVMRCFFGGFLEYENAFIVQVGLSRSTYRNSSVVFLVSMDDFRKYKEDVLYHSRIINTTFPEWVEESPELYRQWTPYQLFLVGDDCRHGVFDDVFDRIRLSVGDKNV